MKRSEMSSPTYTSLIRDTEHCLKLKLQIYTQPPPLIMHIVGGWPFHPLVFLFVLVVRYPVHREINAPIEITIEPGFALSETKA